MSNKIVEDVKTGLKGIRGAGDALRGSVMEATDRTFDKQPNDATTQASEAKNHAIAEKGTNDMRRVDDRVAEHEVRKHQQQAASTITTTHENENTSTHEESTTGQRLSENQNAPGFAGNGASAPKGTGHHPMPLP